MMKIRRYIVTDPEICHGKPTFCGTRIMVSQVLKMVADGMTWEAIIEQCHNSITKEAIAEAVSLKESYSSFIGKAFDVATLR